MSFSCSKAPDVVVVGDGIVTNNQGGIKCSISVDALLDGTELRSCVSVLEPGDLLDGRRILKRPQE